MHTTRQAVATNSPAPTSKPPPPQASKAPPLKPKDETAKDGERQEAEEPTDDAPNDIDMDAEAKDPVEGSAFDMPPEDAMLESMMTEDSREKCDGFLSNELRKIYENITKHDHT